MTGSDEGVQAGASALPMSPAQSRAGRGLLGWSQGDLAGRVGLPESFVRDFEGGYGDAPPGQIDALRSALMTEGVVFTGGPSAGVRLDPKGGGDEGTRLDALTTENDR